MKTTQQKIKLKLNIDGYKFFETNHSFDDAQTYSNLIQGFMDDLDYKLENMGDSEDEPVDEELYDKTIEDVFDDEVFDSTFWLYWRTMFAFENWHSALEMNCTSRDLSITFPDFRISAP